MLLPITAWFTFIRKLLVGKLDKNVYYLIINFIILYIIYNWIFGSFTGMRIWNTPKIGPYKRMMIARADAILKPSTTFMINYSGNKKFNHIYSSEQERQQVKSRATNYFKKQFGLPKIYLKLFMFDLRVNDKVGYNMDGTHIVDGGFLVYIPPGMRLFGKYGGKLGVASYKSAVIPYGHYIIGNKMKLNYFAVCPLYTFKTYDAYYNPIDCELVVESAEDQNLIGMKGKAQGTSITKKIKNGMEHLVIRNVFTFM